MSNRRFKASALSKQELVFIYKILTERWEEYPALVNTGGKTKSSRQLLITDICDMLAERDQSERRSESQIAERFKHDVNRIRARINQENFFDIPLPFYLEELEEVIREYDKKNNKKPEESTCSTSQDADADCKDEDEQPRKKCQTLTPPELRIFYEMLYDGLDQYMSPSINGKGKVKRQRLMAEIATALNAIPNNIQRTPNQIFERAKQIFKRINERINYEKAAETGDFTSFRNVQIPNDMMALYEKEKDRQMRESENGETQAEELDSSYYDHTMFSTNTLLDIIVKEEPEASCSIQSASNSTPQPSMTALEFHDFHDHDRMEKRRSEAEYMEATRDHGDSQKRKKRKREDDQEQPPESQQPLSIEEKRLKIVDKELEYWDVKIATEKRKLEVLSKMNHYMNFLMVHSSPSPNGNVGQLKSMLNLSSISSILV